MTPPVTPTPPAAPGPAPQPQPRTSRWAVVWSAAQLLIALGATCAVLAYLLLVPGSRAEIPADSNAMTVSETVKQVGSGLLQIDPDTPLGRKLQINELQITTVNEPGSPTAPTLTVTGTVSASLRPGAVKGVVATTGLLAATGGMVAGRGSDYWQFNLPEVLTAYTDWQKSIVDIGFNRTQLLAIQKLAVAKVEAQELVVARLRKTVEGGTDARATLQTEEANLLQMKIQGQKDVKEAENTLYVSAKTEAALARQLQQAGLDPALLQSLSSDVDVVMADVPETYLDRVRIGGGCEARFFGIPNQNFRGQVKSIAPVVSKERRSLRVLFLINDLNDQLRPGMFAEIGLGTDPREVLMAPADSIVHVGRQDYVLVAAEPRTWRVTPVKVGAQRGSQVEILNWLKPGEPPPAPGGLPPIKPGDRVLGQGVILLKPSIVKVVDQEPGGGQ